MFPSVIVPIISVILCAIIALILLKHKQDQSNRGALSALICVFMAYESWRQQFLEPDLGLF